MELLVLVKNLNVRNGFTFFLLVIDDLYFT